MRRALPLPLPRILPGILPRALAAAALLCTAGCGTGIIYTETVRPLSTDFHATPFGERTEKGDVKTIRYYVSVSWNENAIGRIAKKHGIDEIYFADLETLSVFFGIWSQRWVRIRGRVHSRRGRHVLPDGTVVPDDVPRFD